MNWASLSAAPSPAIRRRARNPRSSRVRTKTTDSTQAIATWAERWRRQVANGAPVRRASFSRSQASLRPRSTPGSRARARRSESSALTTGFRPLRSAVGPSGVCQPPACFFGRMPDWHWVKDAIRPKCKSFIYNDLPIMAWNWIGSRLGLGAQQDTKGSTVFYPDRPLFLRASAPSSTP